MRITGLDSLRGVAALVVVMAHVYLIMFLKNSPFLFEMDYTPIRFIINGRLAVVFFFALSGFVLTDTALPDQPGFSYKAYLLRRLARIYLPYLFVMATAWELYKHVHAFSGTVNWNIWRAPTGPDDVFGMLFMRGYPNDNNLDIVVWSLFVEIQLSFIFPALAWLLKKYRLLALAGSLILSFVAGLVFKHLNQDPDRFNEASTALGRLMLTTYYVQFFALGSFIALNRDTVIAWTRKVPKYVHVGIMVCLVLVPFKLYGTHLRYADLVNGIMACLLIVYCISYARVNTALSGGLLQWLGRISYSLYLVHIPLLFAAVHLLEPYLPLDVIMLVGLPVVLVAAHLTHRYVEIPAIQVGRKLTARLAFDQST